MQILGKLWFKNNVGIERYLGIRIENKGKLYDIDMDACKNYNIEVVNLAEDKKIVLKDYGGKLCSEQEIAQALYIEDISRDFEMLDTLFFEKAERELIRVSVKSEPIYTKGIAMILKEIDDLACEFSQLRLDYHFTLCVENENVLVRVSKALGWRLPLEEALNKYKNGVRRFDIVLSEKELNDFNCAFDFKLHILKSGLIYKYKNSYTGLSYTVTVCYPYFDLPYNRDFDYWAGSIACGKSLYNFVDEIIGSMEKGLVICLEG